MNECEVGHTTVAAESAMTLVQVKLLLSIFNAALFRSNVAIGKLITISQK